MQQGKLVHAQGHAFEHIGPRLSRRGDYYNTQGSSGASSNPWGNRALGAGYSRGLARLHERYGISTP